VFRSLFGSVPFRFKNGGNVFGMVYTDWFDLSKGFLGKPVPNGPKK